MNLKKAFLILFLIPTFLHAQKVLEFPTEIEKLKSNNWSFNIDEVIDVRNAITPNYMGRVQTGAFNSKRDAILKKPLAEELEAVVKKLIPTVKDTMHLILKVNRLKVWEQTFIGIEEAYSFADFELIMKTDTAQYLIDSYSGFVKKRSSWDVTSSHVKNVTSILKSALETFQKNQNWQLSEINFQKLEPEEVLSKSAPQILVDSVKIKGIYRHFGEFLNNSPTMPLEYEERKGAKILIVADEKGKKKYVNHPADVWGFCDGENVYVSQEGNFFPISFEKDMVKFKGYNVQRRANSVQMGYIFFGVIGAAIANSNADTEWLEINMNSGQFFPVKENNK